MFIASVMANVVSNKLVIAIWRPFLIGVAIVSVIFVVYIVMLFIKRIANAMRSKR